MTSSAALLVRSLLIDSLNQEITFRKPFCAESYFTTHGRDLYPTLQDPCLTGNEIPCGSLTEIREAFYRPRLMCLITLVHFP